MRRLLEADLTWTGERFETGVQIEIDGKGRIARVGVLQQSGAERLNGIALLPGMVNTHSHAFQRGLRGRGESFPRGAGSFWSWRESMYELVSSLDRNSLRRLSAQAFAEMRDAGITAVGEFHYVHHERNADFALDEAVLEAARDAGIRLVLLYCYYATSAPGKPLEGAQQRFATPSVDVFWRQVDRLAGQLDGETQSLGVAPHSIRAASPKEIAVLHQEAIRRGLPVHLHVEEQGREIEESIKAYGRRPMELILDAVQGGSFTAIHCTHTKEVDLQRFIEAKGIVCLCPLTEGNLGDGIPRLASGESGRSCLALGTDSNNRLSMIEEMRWLEYGQRLGREMRGALPDAHGRIAPVLLAAATSGGAQALGLTAGSIVAGCWADLVAIDVNAPSLNEVPTDDLLEAVVFGSGNEAIAGTYVGGRWRPTGQGV